MNLGSEPELIVKNDRVGMLVVNFILIAAAVGVGWYQGNLLFNWNNNAVGNIVFLLLCLFAAASLIKTFDTTPQLKIDAKGIWKKKAFWSSGIILKVAWDNIAYYYIAVVTDRGVSAHFLLVRTKDTDSEIRIALDDWKTTREELIQYIHPYAAKYGFSDLTNELS
jgi:hypothetical protein